MTASTTKTPSGKPPRSPRKIDPARTFDSLVQWIGDTARQQHAPGLIVGISGTDSILTFLACARAFEKLGKPGRVLGVHFAHQAASATTTSATTPAATPPVMSDEFNLVARDIFPWLRQQAPQAQLEMDTTLAVSDDNKRWGHLFSRAVRDTAADVSLSHNFYFPVGTRNATEDHLGNYAQASKAVSMLPLVDLFKSEVLEICAHLGVPQSALDRSRMIDCACGRFDVQADHLQELDQVIMTRMGLLDKSYLTTMPKDVLQKVVNFYVEERARNEFRNRTPYRPSSSLVREL